eukprot:EG_transcript_11801
MSGGAAPEALKFTTKRANYVAFSPDCSRFAVGDTGGLALFSTQPYRQLFRADFRGSVAVVEMGPPPIVAVVGVGGDPSLPSNKVVLFDTVEEKAVAEVPLPADAHAVRLTPDWLLVALAGGVRVYRRPTWELHSTIDTGHNPHGLLAVSTAGPQCVLVCPTAPEVLTESPHLPEPEGRRGQLTVHRLPEGPPTHVAAHQSPATVVALSADGGLLATASEKGTLIRVFDTATGDLRREFRRGADRATVYCLAFSPDAALLVASSNTGTIHVFAVQPAAAPNRRSRLSFFSGFCNYVASEWSFAWHRGPEQPCLCGFAPGGAGVLVVRASGEFGRLAFDPVKGGEMVATSP